MGKDQGWKACQCEGLAANQDCGGADVAGRRQTLMILVP